jgi:hypothetical protein
VVEPVVLLTELYFHISILAEFDYMKPLKPFNACQGDQKVVYAIQKALPIRNGKVPLSCR